MTDPATPPVTIRMLGAAAAAGARDALAALLVDAVAHGASVNFMAGFTDAAARAFWDDQFPAIAAGGRLLLAAEAGPELVGCVVLTLAPQPNAPHRAEIGKMLVHSAWRRRGIGRRLLGAAEEAARAAGRSLLLLDTEAGSAGETLYRRCGWSAIGSVPDHAFTPDGRLAATTMFYKNLTGTLTQSAAAPPHPAVAR